MFKQKNTVKIDMKDVCSEQESLANFLSKHSKLNSSLTPHGLEVNGDEISTFALARIVTKFVSSKGLNSTHWVTVEGNEVKIKRFNHEKKEKKNKHPQTAATIKHGW